MSSCEEQGWDGVSKKGKKCSLTACAELGGRLGREKSAQGRQ